MRICLFTSSFLPSVGGMEVVTDSLARQLVELGHHVVVLAMSRPDSQLPYRVETYPKSRWWRHWPELTARYLKRLHEREHFDVICSNYGNPTGYGAVRFGRRAGVPVVVVSHGSDLHRGSNDRRRPRIWKRVQYAYRHADAAVAISPHTQQIIREIRGESDLIELIPNGVDIAAMRQDAPRPADFTDTRPFALCLGNLRPVKGFDRAIAAFAEVAPRLDDLALVIVGSGPQEPALRQQAADLGIADRVLFAGHRAGPDKRWFLRHCAFGLMPSLEEGHPIVALELLACGKALVCSDLAAFDGMYDDGVNAIRVDAANTRELAAALVSVHHADRGEMERHSREHAAAFDLRTMALRYEKLFQTVAARGNRTCASVSA